jgi:pimeloyl-ACP methyl ester carboxylesterase
MPETKNSIAEAESREALVRDPVIEAIRAETRRDWHTILSGKPETFALGDGQKLQVVDFPAEKPTSDVPVVMVPGFTETPFSLAPNIHGLNQAGRRVLGVANPHGIDTLVQREYPHPQLRKAIALLAMLDAKGIARADLVAHSEGAVVASIAAKLAPGRIRSIVLFNPAGLLKREGLISLVGRAGREAYAGMVAPKLFGRPAHVKGDAEHAEVLRNGDNEMKKYVFGSLGNAAHSVRELWSLAGRKARIDGMLKDLQAQGVQVHGVFSEHDHIYPLARSGRLKQLTGQGVLKAENAQVIAGGHNTHVEDHYSVTKALNDRLQQIEADDAVKVAAV